MQECRRPPPPSWKIQKKRKHGRNETCHKWYMFTINHYYFYISNHLFPCKSSFNYQILTISQPPSTDPSFPLPTNQATLLAVAKSIHVSKPQEETLKKTRFEARHISNPKFFENRNLNTLFLTSFCCKNPWEGDTPIWWLWKCDIRGPWPGLFCMFVVFLVLRMFFYLSPSGVAQCHTALYKTNKWL